MGLRRSSSKWVAVVGLCCWCMGLVGWGFRGWENGVGFVPFLGGVDMPTRVERSIPSPHSCSQHTGRVTGCT